MTFCWVSRGEETPWLSWPACTGHHRNQSLVLQPQRNMFVAAVLMLPNRGPGLGVSQQKQVAGGAFFTGVLVFTKE